MVISLCYILRKACWAQENPFYTAAWQVPWGTCGCHLLGITADLATSVGCRSPPSLAFSPLLCHCCSQRPLALCGPQNLSNFFLFLKLPSNLQPLSLFLPLPPYHVVCRAISNWGLWGLLVSANNSQARGCQTWYSLWVIIPLPTPSPF
jgi:hypothetical protein